MNMKDYTKELSFAKNLAYRAGDVMLKYLPSSVKKVKENNSPVTEADIAISKIIIAEISKNFPKHAIIDEEIKSDIQNAEYVWVCDPLDGTIPFANGVPTSMFSLALCQNQKPVVAVCYDPFMKRLYYSSENNNSFLNDQKIEVNKNDLSRGECILAVPYWFNNFLKPKEFNINLFYKLLHEKNLILSLVESCVYSSMLVASGKITATILPAAYPWDRAAAKLIIKNANGLYLDENRKEITVFGKYGLGIVTNRIVSDQILKIVDTCLIDPLNKN